MINYIHKFCPNESSAGGTLLNIWNHCSYKHWNDLCIYKAIELESSFIEISNPKRSNLIIGHIYRHPNMDLDEFNDNYLNILLDKILVTLRLTFRNMISIPKQINSWTSFLHMFLLYIVQPTTISTTSRNPIDNIFSNIHIPVLSQVIW